MMNRSVSRLRFPCAAALMFMVGGCATNTIRLDRADTMTTTGRDAAAATQDLMKQVRRENRSALVDIVAADPNCTLPSPVIMQGTADAGASLCRKGAREQSDFALTRFASRDFQASLSVIGGLTAYLDAVDAVVTREPLDLGTTVIEAHEELFGISADIATIAGSSPTAGLTNDQKAAVGGTLALLGEIIDEAERVDDLRKLEIKSDPKAFGVSLDALSAANRKWLTALDAQIDNRRILAERQIRRMTTSPVEQRRKTADELMTLIERQEELPQFASALDETVDALREAHEDYRSLLFGDGRQLTAKERKKAAAITRARLRAALKNLAAVVRAF